MSASRFGITGFGAVTPVGLSAPATCAALRAAIPRMVEFEGWADAGEAPPEGMVAGRVPTERLHGVPQEDWPGHERWKLPPPVPDQLIAPGDERLLELALPAAEEALARAGRPAGRMGLYLGLDDADHSGPLAESLARGLGATFDVVRGDRLGRAAGLAALHRGLRHLREDRVDVALVGGVDSLLRRVRLAELDAAGGLKIGGAAAGIIPGEAAAFLVIEPGAGSPIAHVLGTAVTSEPTAGTDEPNQGVGLTRALRAAYAAAGGAPPDYPWVACDLNGEHYRVHEWVFAGLRAMNTQHNRPGGPRHVDVRHPADCIGDVGAASGVLNVVWASVALAEGYAGIDHAMVWGASDGPLRAVALLALGPSYGD